MKLFVYGTLKSNVVLAAVLGRNNNLPKYIPATLHGYFKSGLNIIPYSNSSVDGYVLEIESEQDWKSLDHYENVEGELYKRIDVKVELDNQEIVDATAYQKVGEYDL